MRLAKYPDSATDLKGDSRRTLEKEVTPSLPTSGQVLGTVMKNLGIKHRMLRSQTARRYFSGRRVKDSKRAEIIGAISDALMDQGFGATAGREEDASPSLTATLDWHAVEWDRLRAFLRPRMQRVLPGHLAEVWQVYVRLCVIDLALRIAAHTHLMKASPKAVDFLDWVTVSRRGAYLNRKRRESGFTLENLAELTDVNNKTVEAWVYDGARPSDENIIKIAKVLASTDESSDWHRQVREFRRVYWVSDIARNVGDYIGAEVADGIVGRLKRYCSLVYQIIDEETDHETRADSLADLGTLGVRSQLAEPLLNELASRETDNEWKKDLTSASSDWISRVLSVNLRVHQAEENALINETEGRVLKEWDVGNAKAYAHYQRSMELQIQGRIDEALEEVAKAAELDPLDPANHYTLGSVIGGIGARNSDETLVDQGLESLWIATTLDRSWILPWTEIGWLLVRTGRPKEAVRHLLGVNPERKPFDARYYSALGAALHHLGEYSLAMEALKSSLKLDPDDPLVAAAAATAAELAGDARKSNHYSKMARHLGASEASIQFLEQVKEIRAGTPSSVTKKNREREIADLNADIRSNPDNSAFYLARGRAFFLNGEDRRAIPDLDEAIRLDPGNADAYQARGIVHTYMKQFSKVIPDLSQAVQLNGGDYLTYYFRGIAYGEQEAFDLAVDDLGEAIRLNPAYVDAYRARGDAQRYRRDYDLAIADYSVALRLNPEHSSSYRGRGAALRMKREFDLAIADFDDALRLDPDDAFAYRFRGDAYLAKGDYERAIVDFGVALSMNSTDDIAYRGRGNARLFSGELDLALAEFDAAVECNPESDLAYYGRGVVHEVMGNLEGAEQDYRRARELGYDDSN